MQRCGWLISHTHATWKRGVMTELTRTGHQSRQHERAQDTSSRCRSWSSDHSWPYVDEHGSLHNHTTLDCTLDTLNMTADRMLLCHQPVMQGPVHRCSQCINSLEHSAGVIAQPPSRSQNELQFQRVVVCIVEEVIGLQIRPFLKAVFGVHPNGRNIVRLL